MAKDAASANSGAEASSSSTAGGKTRSGTPGPSKRSETPSNEDATNQEDQVKPAAQKKEKKKQGFLGKSSNFIVMAMLGYFAFIASKFRTILWPVYADIDPVTHRHIPRHGNVFQGGDELEAKIWVSKTAWPVKQKPLAAFDIIYDWDAFKPVARSLNVSVPQAYLKKGTNMLLSVEVLHKKTGRVIKAKGDLVKKIKTPEIIPKYRMYDSSLCPEDQEPSFGSNKYIARGIPMMQIRVVYDDTAYPNWMVPQAYTPRIFVDEFWMTNDQLVKLNTTGANNFSSEATFGLMSAARWRFQNHMEQSLKMNAQLFGEDSEELLQMRDLFANTNPYLLAMTMVVSVLHMIFEFLAFKHDVDFWQQCNVDDLSKYVSVQSILVGILFQVLLTMYLWDESANFLVLLTSVVSIVIDAWKVTRAMKPTWTRLGGVPVPCLTSKVKKEKQDDFDSIAMKWLAVLLSPAVIGYAIYTFFYDCHRGWYSYFLTCSASCVYSLGFVLMTPQVFINYKHKTVAYLPWKKFVYRAICTFIDDLFAFIIKMPTMHRMAVFRDDIVFFVYLGQRYYYPVDKSRTFDEDGYDIAPAAEDNGSEEKKDR